MALAVALVVAAVGSSASSASSLPDLRVDSVSKPPAKIHPGSTFKVKDKTQNVGTSQAAASSTRYYLSADKRKGGKDVLLKGTRHVPKLSAGETSKGSVKVTVPSKAKPSSYHLLACADDRNAVRESQEKNDCDASKHIAAVAACAATDAPDVGFVDSNCDGIDGNAAKAIFVSPTGSDANPGTESSPKRTIGAGIAAAAAAGKDVYVAQGIYDVGPGLALASGVGVYGGYDPSSWARSAIGVTKLEGSPQAVIADGDVNVVLQLLTLQGSADSLGCAYGVRAVNGSALILEADYVSAGDGAAGRPGSNGRAGAVGGPGVRGADGTCDDNLPGAPGGPGGGSGGFAGGNGGKGGDYGANAGSAGARGLGPLGGNGGAGGAGGDPGHAGANGVSGGAGGAGAGGGGGAGLADLAGPAWLGHNGVTGTPGTPGSGGGGGGGGGGQGCTFCDDGNGNGGGGGGAGGVGGGPGGGGSAGGGSFGVYLWSSSVTVTAGSTVQAGNGGAGGAGGAGANGGGGGAGGAGGSTCVIEIGRGGNGGNGGAGGPGGAGGGGAGGPSIGIFRGGGSTATTTASTIVFGAPGAGGSSPAGGASNGAPGIATPVFAP